MNFPPQVNVAELKCRVELLIDSINVELKHTGHYGLLPHIRENLLVIYSLLTNNYPDVEEIDMYAAGAGMYVIQDSGMPFSDTPLGNDICGFTGDIHEMFWTGSAITMIEKIIKKYNVQPVDKDIYEILININRHFATDGKKDFDYLNSMKDKLREIRAKYGEKLGPEYQEIFQILMG